MAAGFISRLMLRRGNARLKGIEYATYTGWIKEFIPKYNEKDLNKIVSIEQEARRGTVFDVEVDGDHLFCLASGIQTHNSLIAATLLAVNGSEFFTQDGEEFIVNKTRDDYQEAAEITDGVKQAPVAASAAEQADTFMERVKREDWLCAPAQKQMILNLLARIITSGGS